MMTIGRVFVCNERRWGRVRLHGECRSWSLLVWHGLHDRKGETAGLDPIRRAMTSRATVSLRPAPCNLRTKKIKKLTTYGYIHSDWQKQTVTKTLYISIVERFLYAGLIDSPSIPAVCPPAAPTLRVSALLRASRLPLRGYPKFNLHIIRWYNTHVACLYYVIS